MVSGDEGWGFGAWGMGDGGWDVRQGQGRG